MIIFSEHAALKLFQRKINKDIVIQTINDPDHKSETFGDRVVAYKDFGKLHMKVVYKVELDDIIIITAHWIAKAK